MSFNVAPADRSSALAALRDKRKKKGPINSLASSISAPSPPVDSNPNGASSSAPSFRPPVQMRDATAVPLPKQPSWLRERSSFTPPSTPSALTGATPVILVSDSSPPTENPSPPKLEYRPHQSHHLAWANSKSMRSDALLTGSSGFQGTSSSFASYPSASTSSQPQQASKFFERPQKKARTDAGFNLTPIDLSSSPMAITSRIPASPSSPDLSRPRKRYAGQGFSSDVEDITSPISSPAAVGPNRRIIRGRPKTIETLSLSSSASPAPTSELDLFLQMRGDYIDEAGAKGIWEDSKGNLQQAFHVLSQLKSNIDAQPINGKNGSAPLQSKGKQSAIYKKRSEMAAPAPWKAHSSVIIPDGHRRAKKAKPTRSSGSEDTPSETWDSDGDGKMKHKSVIDVEVSDDDDEEEQRKAQEALRWFNEATELELVELTACTQAQAATLIALRPFTSVEDLESRIPGRKGGERIFGDYQELMRGYESVDRVLAHCEKLGNEIANVLKIWSGEKSGRGAADPSSADTDADAGIHLTSLADSATPPSYVDLSQDPVRTAALKDYIRNQPSTLSPDVQLKDYQLLGINWLNLLWGKGFSCILADDMGLGKTIQVIAFFASLKERGTSGPHLIIVPSSTLENWTREFERFAPSLQVQTYYGTQNERIQLRGELTEARGKGRWDILVTTYNLAQGNEFDRKFFKKIPWAACVFDEGHVLKNSQSQRYQNLMRIEARWRLLLTGTPLQNNLQELVSLMNFILPEYFKTSTDSLRAIFKVKADSAASLLSRERVSRAKKMMTPFVLRRRKDHVLKDLPRKTERIEWCDMTPLQRSIYREALQRSRKMLQSMPDEIKPQDISSGTATPTLPAKGKKAAAASKPKKKAPIQTSDTSSHVLMDLRKAASHPMLFRRRFDDAKIKLMARHCLKEPEFMDSNLEYVIEDMQVMTDSELQAFCHRYKSVRQHALEESSFQESGKIQTLLKLLEAYKTDNKRVLIFSQFTQILDILQNILRHLEIRFLVLTGQTPVDERQGLVDEFTEDAGIPIFLLSTRAGGMGINLTAASVVIIFDQDFNPHNDKQACDRAYRIGQKQNVEVIKLISKGTVEEDMFRLGQTKLALDEAVAGDGEEEDEAAPEKAMKASLLSVLRRQFEQEESAVMDLDVEASVGAGVEEQVAGVPKVEDPSQPKPNPPPGNGIGDAMEVVEGN